MRAIQRSTFWCLAALALSALGIALFLVVGPYRLYIVHTGSMEPTIPSRSAVIVQLHQFHVGEPVAFMEQGGVITHRLLNVSSDGTITTKGDANATPDPWHPPVSAVLGGVVAAPPNLGYWLCYLKNPMGLISIALAALVCWQLWAIITPRPRTQESQCPVAHIGR